MQKTKGRTGLFVLVALLLALAIAPAAYQSQPPSKPGQDEFVPLDQLSREEDIPAAPLVMAAYAIAWLLVFVYLWSIWQRTAKVERDMAELSRRINAGERR